MSETKQFHIGDILTVTTDIFCTPNGMGGVYGILNWMTGDDLMTHQLPRAGGECAPELRRQFPDLAAVEPPVFSGRAAGEAWLAGMVERYGETREVVPLPAGDHTVINPLVEMAMNHPNVKVISVEH